MDNLCIKGHIFQISDYKNKKPSIRFVKNLRILLICKSERPIEII